MQEECNRKGKRKERMKNRRESKVGEKNTREPVVFLKCIF